MDAKTGQLRGRSSSRQPLLPAQSVQELERRVNNTDDPDELRSQIETTRTHMTRTVNQIQERLSPENLKEQAQEAFHDATVGKVEEMAYTAKRKANNWREGLADTVKENPIPAAVAGFGLAWLFMSGKSSDNDYDEYDYDYDYNAGGYGRFPNNRRNVYAADYDYDYDYDAYGEPSARQRVRRTAQDARDTVSDWADDAQQQASSLTNQAQRKAQNVQQNVQQTAQNVQQNVQETAHNVQQNVQETAEEWRESAYETYESAQENAQYYTRRARRASRQTWQENPLAVGVAAAAAGAIFGLMIPTTEAENRWMGETRDRLLSQAQDMAGDTLSKAENVAQEVAATAKDKAQEIASEAKDAAKDVKATAKQEAKQQNLGKPQSPPVRGG